MSAARRRLCVMLAGAIGWVGCADETAVIGYFETPRREVERATPASSNGGTSGEGSGGSAGSAGAADENAFAAAGSGDAGGESGSPAPPAVGDTLEIEAGTRAQFCVRSGPAVRVVSKAGRDICTPSLGRRLFTYGICSCSDMFVSPPSSVLVLDSFDSREGEYRQGENGGALGVNGTLKLLSATVLSVSGNTILVAGAEQLRSSAVFNQDLKVGAPLAAMGIFSVGRDLWVKGDLQLPPLVATVGRDVYQTPSHTGTAMFTSIGGEVRTQPFDVEPPCACGADAALDIAAIVASAQLAHDGAEVGLSREALSDRLNRGEVPEAFTCGRFATGSVSIPGDTLAKLTGRLALFVDGDLTVNGDFATDLAPGAELDVFVTGDLIVGGPAQLGMPSRPSALRLYIGGDGTIRITDVVTYAAHIYAPAASVVAMGSTPQTSTFYLSTYGSIFAGRFEATTLLRVDYDRAILSAGESCESPPPPRCDRCNQCPAGLACVEGACNECRNDADCCEPFRCVERKCQPLK